MPGRITALEAGCGSRVVEVHVDGQPWRRLNRRLVKRAGIGVGSELDDETLCLLDEQERILAEEISLRLLTHRSRSVQEMTTRLAASGIGSEAAGDQIARLRCQGYLDDLSFAREWVDDRVRVGGHGRQRISRELAAHGVSPELIQRALEAGCPAERELERAMELLGSATVLLRAAERDRAGKRKAWQWLVRRGYSSEIAYQAVSLASEGRHGD
ncbi:MAG: hypothetical protein C4521_05665 [Actinobacteria bacterium]|nr:MAG: hypothetical protein C4521_05665 [Actinomycetota bacterium]